MKMDLQLIKLFISCFRLSYNYCQLVYLGGFIICAELVPRKLGLLPSPAGSFLMSDNYYFFDWKAVLLISF